MENYFFKDDEILTVDLHYMREWEAVLYLNKIMQIAPNSVREIVVIHGYHNGLKLLNMVRKDYKNPRIKKKFISLNQGVTSLILKEER